MLNVLRLRLQGIGDWLSAVDPGFIRTQLGLRAALATLTTWLVMLVISIPLTGVPVPALGLFGALMCFLAFLVINDPLPADRRVTTLLAIFPIAAAITLASLLADLFWIRIITLLALLFLSFYLRRYGLRALELSLLAVLGYYYASLIGVRPDMLVILLLGVGVGLASAFMFQFVILPADPLRSTRRAIGVFYRLVAETIGETARGLDDKVNSTGWDKLLQRRMRQIHYARYVIDSQLAAAAAALPLQWTIDRITRLQVALYSAEQGLGLMGEEAKALREKLAELPDDLERSLIRTLNALQDAVANLASAESVAATRCGGEPRQCRECGGTAPASRGITGACPRAIGGWTTRRMGLSCPASQRRRSRGFTCGAASACPGPQCGRSHSFSAARECGAAGRQPDVKSASDSTAGGFRRLETASDDGIRHPGRGGDSAGYERSSSVWL